MVVDQIPVTQYLVRQLLSVLSFKNTIFNLCIFFNEMLQSSQSSLHDPSTHDLYVCLTCETDLT